LQGHIASVCKKNIYAAPVIKLCPEIRVLFYTGNFRRFLKKLMIIDAKMQKNFKKEKIWSI